MSEAISCCAMYNQARACAYLSEISTRVNWGLFASMKSWLAKRWLKYTPV